GADQARLVDQVGGAGGLERRGQPRVPLVHRDRRAFGELAVLLDGLGLDLVPVDRPTTAVRDQDDQATVRNAGEHPLDDPAGLVHARAHHHHAPLARPDRLRRDPQAAPALPARLVLAAAVQLDDPLELMDANGSETLSAVRSLQTHAATVPP